MQGREVDDFSVNTVLATNTGRGTGHKHWPRSWPQAMATNAGRGTGHKQWPWYWPQAPAAVLVRNTGCGTGHKHWRRYWPQALAAVLATSTGRGNGHKHKCWPQALTAVLDTSTGGGTGHKHWPRYWPHKHWPWYWPLAMGLVSGSSVAVEKLWPSPETRRPSWTDRSQRLSLGHAPIHFGPALKSHGARPILVVEAAN